MNGHLLKEKHCCTDLKCCNFCRQPKEQNHQCKMKVENVENIWPKLAFLGMQHFDNSSENCLQCFEMRSENTLFCSEHKNLQDDFFDTNEPILTIIYAEENTKGTFTKYELNNFANNPVLLKSENVISYDYVIHSQLSNNNNLQKNKSSRKSKITQDFKTNYQSMQNENALSLMDMLLQLITSENWRNTTFICQDEDSLIQVSSS